MSTIRMAREVQLAAVDVAGQTVGADMAGGAAANIVVPKRAKQITKMRVAFSSDCAALGAAIGVLILTGRGVVEQQHILLGGAGAEDIDAHHGGTIVTIMEPAGIDVNGGEEIVPTFMMVGVDGGTVTCLAEFVFSDTPRSPSMQHVCGNVDVAAIDTDTQLQGLGDGVAATIRVPQRSTKILAIQTAIASDFSALGSGGLVALLSGPGVKDDQEIVLGAAGGENITAAGANIPPSYEYNADIEVSSGDSIRIDLRMVGEDIGDPTGCIGLGFEIAGGPRGGGR